MIYEKFCEVIEPLYRQFRPRMDPDLKAKDLGDKFRVLQRFTPDVLLKAVDTLMQDATNFPFIATIRQSCYEAQRTLYGNANERYRTWDDPLHCPCACGGELWSRVLYDNTGAERRFDGTDPTGLGAELLSALPPGTRSAVAVQMLKLAGKVMTRDYLDCRKRTITPELERGVYLKTDSRGVRIYGRAEPTQHLLPAGETQP